MEPESSRERLWFATTQWSVVLNAADSVSPEAATALETLCRSYWYPLYVYIRRRGYDTETAKDLTQEFFAQLLAKRLLHAVDPTKGKFRAWLLGVMKHFLAHEWTKRRAQKRENCHTMFSFDELDAETRYQLEPSEEWSPEKLFDRRWALTVLEHAATKLRQEFQDSQRADLFTAIKDFLSIEGTSSTYEQCAAGIGLSVSAVKNAIHRLRKRYQQLIREEIAQTVSTASEVDEEIRYLLAIVRG